MHADYDLKDWRPYRIQKGQNRVRDALTYIKQVQSDLQEGRLVSNMQSPVMGRDKIRSVHHAVKWLEEAVQALEPLNKQEGDN